MAFIEARSERRHILESLHEKQPESGELGSEHEVFSKFKVFKHFDKKMLGKFTNIYAAKTPGSGELNLENLSEYGEFQAIKLARDFTTTKGSKVSLNVLFNTTPQVRQDPVGRSKSAPAMKTSFYTVDSNVEISFVVDEDVLGDESVLEELQTKLDLAIKQAENDFAQRGQEFELEDRSNLKKLSFGNNGKVYGPYLGNRSEYEDQVEASQVLSNLIDLLDKQSE